MTIINLRERFGDTYRIAYDEAYQHERSEFRAIEEPHLQQIPCPRGHIYPVDGDTLAVFVAGGITREKLRTISGCRLVVDGSDGATFTFDVDCFAAVAEVVKPRRRRHLSESQRLASIERLREYRFPARQSVSESAGHVQTPKVDTLAVQRC